MEMFSICEKRYCKDLFEGFSPDSNELVEEDNFFTIFSPSYIGEKRFNVCYQGIELFLLRVFLEFFFFCFHSSLYIFQRFAINFLTFYISCLLIYFHSVASVILTTPTCNQAKRLLGALSLQTPTDFSFSFFSLLLVVTFKVDTF
jgi:hypothetical protein